MADRKHGGGLEGGGKEGQGSPQKCVVTRFEAPGLKEPQGPWRCVAGGAFGTRRCGLRPRGSQVFKETSGHPGERAPLCALGWLRKLASPKASKRIATFQRPPPQRNARAPGAP